VHATPRIWPTELTLREKMITPAASPLRMRFFKAGGGLRPSYAKTIRWPTIWRTVSFEAAAGATGGGGGGGTAALSPGALETKTDRIAAMTPAMTASWYRRSGLGAR